MLMNRYVYIFVFVACLTAAGGHNTVLARSLGTSELQKDTTDTIVLHALVKKWAGWPSDCEKASVENVVVIEKPTSRTSGWKERWSMLACGAVVDIDVSYTSAPDGGTLIRTDLAAKQTADNPGREIVGLWTGTVVQAGVGKIETWLTFVSAQSGVSQYPADNCGGVLAGKMLQKAVYEYSEKIAWGRATEDEDGCIDGQMRLTVRGEELDLQFSAVHNGKKETASGTLRRFSRASRN